MAKNSTITNPLSTANLDVVEILSFSRNLIKENQEIKLKLAKIDKLKADILKQVANMTKDIDKQSIGDLIKSINKTK